LETVEAEGVARKSGHRIIGSSGNPTPWKHGVIRVSGLYAEARNFSAEAHRHGGVESIYRGFTRMSAAQDND
jgi:hypothetical protein